MTSVPTPLEHGWWIASRSAGIVALLAITASVILGLLMANGLPRRKGATRVLVSLHESTALAALIAIAVHGVTLLGDPWMHATLWKISVPFSIGYRPLWTSLGIIAGWIAAALGLSYYARKRIGDAPVAQAPPRDRRRLGARDRAHHRRRHRRERALAAGDDAHGLGRHRLPLPAPDRSRRPQARGGTEGRDRRCHGLRHPRQS